jgi:hypothetical protein
MSALAPALPAHDTEAHSQPAQTQLVRAHAYPHEEYPVTHWVPYYEPTPTHDAKYESITHDQASETGVERGIEDWEGQTGTDVDDDETSCSWANSDALSEYGRDDTEEE